MVQFILIWSINSLLFHSANVFHGFKIASSYFTIRGFYIVIVSCVLSPVNRIISTRCISIYKLFTSHIVLCNKAHDPVHGGGQHESWWHWYTSWWEHDCFHEQEVFFCIIYIFADLCDPKTKSFSPRKCLGSYFFI